MVRRDHRAAGGPSVALAAPAGRVHPPPRRFDHDANLLIDSCRRSGFEPRVHYRATYLELPSALVRQGLGVALLPRMFVLPRPWTTSWPSRSRRTSRGTWTLSTRMSGLPLRGPLARACTSKRASRNRTGQRASAGQTREGMNMDESATETIRWLVDRAQISELLYGFASALDTKDPASLCRRLHRGGILELPRPDLVGRRGHHCLS